MRTPPLLPLELAGVCYAVDGTPLLHELNFTLRHGARSVIVGPNGAGKSLTLRLCHGLIAPTAGSVRWLGGGAGFADALRTQQAMVFQRPVLLRRSAAANIDHALKLRGLDRASRRTRTQAALAQTGLAALADRPARALSLGEQQRLALARAWALSPQVLFLDEPTASLDPAATRQVETLIANFHAAGVKIVMTTHDLGQARRLADEILFLHHGRLVEHAGADAFFDAPQTAEARAFVRGELLW
jgi:tungstate transport system ATP-binding protein